MDGFGIPVGQTFEFFGKTLHTRGGVGIPVFLYVGFGGRAFLVEIDALVGQLVEVLRAFFYQFQHVFQRGFVGFVDIAHGQARFHQFG